MALTTPEISRNFTILDSEKILARGKQPARQACGAPDGGRRIGPDPARGATFGAELQPE